MAISLKVLAPNKNVYQGEAEEVILPSTTGQLGILPGHISIVTAIDIGVLRLRMNSQWKSIALMGGFAEIESDEVIVLVNNAEIGSEINVQDAEKDLTEAKLAISKFSETEKSPEKIFENAISIFGKNSVFDLSNGKMEKIQIIFSPKMKPNIDWGGYAGTMILNTKNPKDIVMMADDLRDLFGIEEAIAKGSNGLLNGKILRFKNEPVRHKTLDLIGDLALLGVPIKGHVTAARAGHASNVEFVKKLKKKYNRELNALKND